MPRLPMLIDQFDRTRRYTQMVLNHTDRQCWFTMAPGCPSHVAWEIGHIAWAQALHVFRTVGGQNSVDPVPESWGMLFGKGSVVVADPAKYPSADELMTTFTAGYERCMAFLATLPDSILDEPASHQTGLVRNKLDILYFVMRHESIHTGHIALIRRLFGEGPYR